MRYVLRIAFLAICTIAPFTPAWSVTWYSVASGNAETAAVWSLITTGPGSTAAALGGFNNTVDLVVQNGYTIDLTTTGNINIHDLQVDAGGKFYSTNATNRYANIYGNILCNGTIGNNGIYNSICFNIEGTNTTISGTGYFEASRIRKNAVVNVVTNLVIAMNMNLRWNSGTATQLYNNATNSVFNITINAGCTVSLLAGNISIDGLAGNGFNEMSGTVTVNGTLVVSNITYLQTNNAIGGNSCNLVVGPTGLVRTYQAAAGLSGVGGHNLTIQPGGKFELTGTPAFTPFSINFNTYSCLPGSIVEYSANGNQVVQSAFPYGNLIFSGTGIKTTNGNLTIENNLTISGAAILSPVAFSISLKGDWNNWGSGGFTEGISTVNFNGTAAQSLNGTVSEGFYNLNILNNSITGVTLNSDATVANSMDLFTDGRLTFGLVARTVSLTQNAFVQGLSGSGAAVIDMNNALHLLEIAAWDCQYSGFLFGGPGTVEFNGTNNGSGNYQNIVTGPNISYNNILITGSGPKSLISDLLVGGWLTVDGLTVDFVPIVSLRTMSIAGNLTLVNGGTMNDNCYNWLIISTIGNNAQSFIGNGNTIKMLDLVSSKTAGGISLAGPAGNTQLYASRDLLIGYQGTAVFTDGGNTIQAGDDAEFGIGAASSLNFNLTGLLRFTGLGGDLEIHISKVGGGALSTPAQVNHLEVATGSAVSTNNRLNVSPNSGGQSLTVKGNLTLLNSAYFDLWLNLLYVGGNWTSWNAVGFADAGTTVIFNGTANQTISCPGGEAFTNITVNKPTGTLNLSVLIDVIGTFNFTSGIVNSTLVNIPRMYSGASAINTSDISHVNGPVRKSGTGAFTFPVGKNGKYRPIAISGMPLPSIFTAEYFQVDPQVVPLNVNAKDPTLDHISRCEYWNLNRTSGTTAIVTLRWAATSCGVTSLPDLRVAGWDGGSWKDHGNGGTTGNILTGTIISTGAIGVFGPFTLSSTLAGQNPLPVEWLSFEAIKSGSKVDLVWSTASEINSAYFDIERSIDGVNYSVLGTISSAGNSIVQMNYHYEDLNPKRGINFYRIRQVDIDGVFGYSNVETVDFGFKNQTFSIYPNPSDGHLTFSLPILESGDAPAFIKIIDETGRVVKLIQWNDTFGSQVNLSELPSGWYFSSFETAGGARFTAPFVIR